MSDTDDDRLGPALTDLGAALTTTAPDITDRVRAVLEQPAHRHSLVSPRLVAAAVVLLMIMTAILAIPRARSATADLLGIGRTEVILVEDPPIGTPTSLPTGQGSEADIEEASAQLGFVVRLPDRALVGEITAWETRPLDKPRDLIVVFDTVSLTIRPLDSNTIVNQKLPSLDDRVIYAKLQDGSTAIWIEASHALLRGDNVEQSGQVLVWTSGTLEYRLADAQDLETALAIANSAG